ncbi:MAG: DUF3667 domain-containing protein [Gammaproteobacteria bacterium]|nr:DUF3667 domain-containing protein [Gammaproteobacteria bacterium]
MNVNDEGIRRRSSRIANAARATGAVICGAVAGAIVLASAGTVLLYFAQLIMSRFFHVYISWGTVLNLLYGVIGVSIVVGTIWGGFRVGKQLRATKSTLPDNQNGLNHRTSEEPVVCSNCGFARQGKWCSTCGQNDRDYRRLFPVLSEVVGEMFEADSRVWRSLRILFLQPGFLSLEFSRNRRAYYLSPFRLYLFASVLYFIVMSFFKGTVDTDVTVAESVGTLNFGIFFEYLPISVLLALPLYALLLQFVFIGRHGYAEHFVFVLHVQTIGFVVLMFFIPWMVRENNLLQYLSYFLALSVYMFFALKRFYSLSWLLTFTGWGAALMIYIVLFCAVMFGTTAVVNLS